MDRDFDGKVALVTGAAHGIGRAACAMFAERGARVVAADVDDSAGAETVELVRSAGGEATFVRTDVSQPAEVEGMVDAAVSTYGRLDFAHNNAGIVGSGLPIPDYPIDDWNRGIGVMLSGVFLGMKYEIPRILEHGDGGAIVNTASGAGLIGFPGMCAYVAAKHGVIGLTKTAALEYATQGVRINSICPGTARTKMVNDWLGGDPENEAQVEALHPIGRIAAPEEIAALVMWLCSDAASFMCGAAIPIDGGYTIQ
jgi:NAD(P)-dependent dehydrogenase (short-subunit alcohol dehydrogenase family)